MTIIASIFCLIASLSPREAIEIGVKVWQNECNGTLEGLTSWNEGEEFASLGIGHFIWVPDSARTPFVETFPELVRFLKSNGVEIPGWIFDARGCPWKNREEFQMALQANTPQINDLRQLLRKSVPLQAQFLQMRLEQALPLLLAHASTEKKAKIETAYQRLIASSKGLFAMLDYVNFKGYGTAKDEAYDGLGWGLYQVLDNMSHVSNDDSVAQFVASAKEILDRRIKHAPPSRHEERFLKGWFNRLDRYLN